MKILIIEDHAVRLLWKELLESFGVQVEVAVTPEEALEKFRMHSDWTVILLDGEIGEAQFNCLPVLTEILRTYSGKIVATSDKVELRKIQMEKGCTEDSQGKPNVLALLSKFIQFPEALPKAA
ncbi:MAG: response regulator [Patescibacteria group bacterium]